VPADEHTERAARTYGAAADHYSLPSLSFWDRFGAATVARLPLAPGHRVLDVCCGAGASALPAARAVGAAGQVLGIDVAAPLLEPARARAAGEGLAHIEFRQGDATRTRLPDGSFDAVVCVFGVSSPGTWRRSPRSCGGWSGPAACWRSPPGGLACSSPRTGHFWEAVGAVAPSLYKAFNPWDEITSTAALAGLLARAGAAQPAVVAVPGQHHLDHPDQFWDIVLGSGYRGTVDALDTEQRDGVWQRLLAGLRATGVTTLRTDVVFGTAERPR